MAGPMLDIRGLTKQFPGVKALRNVYMEVNENEIVGLVGENGAGKSTIMNVLCGTIENWTGEISLRGERIRPRNYHEATLLGITRVFQEQALVPSVAVYENMFISHEDRFRSAGLFLDQKGMVALARKECMNFGLDIDVTKLTSDFDYSTRQAIEIIRSFSISSLLGIRMPCILLDEPTAGLTQQEVGIFFDQLLNLKCRASILFVSHRLSEVLAVCDRVYVLKDGIVVGEMIPGEVDEAGLHELMVGRKRDEDYYKEGQQREPETETILEVTDCTKQGAFEDVCLQAHSGEIVGIGGLLGSGKTELGRAIAGLTALDGGELELAGRVVPHPSLLKMMDMGLGYIPPERHAEGIILYLSVAFNIALPSLVNWANSALGFLSRRKEKDTADKFIKLLDIKTPSSSTLVNNLSGGNQQKVVLAKWLVREPKVLVLDNPTRGVDAGAKEELYALIRELARQGMAIVLITDDLLELIGMSNRILIMKDGRVTHAVEAQPHRKPSETELVRYMV